MDFNFGTVRSDLQNAEKMANGILAVVEATKVITANQNQLKALSDKIRLAQDELAEIDDLREKAKSEIEAAKKAAKDELERAKEKALSIVAEGQAEHDRLISVENVDIQKARETKKDLLEQNTALENSIKENTKTDEALKKSIAQSQKKLEASLKGIQ